METNQVVNILSHNSDCTAQAPETRGFPAMRATFENPYIRFEVLRGGDWFTSNYPLRNDWVVTFK